MTRLSVAVIGAGIAARHLEGFARLRALFDVRLICSLDTDRARELADRHAIPEVVDDYAAVLARPDIAVVDLCTPPHLHFPMAEAALAAGKHVICEKPLFTSLADVDRMERLLAGRRERLMPIFQYRPANGLMKLKYLIDQGLAGKPHLTTIETHWLRRADYYDVPWRGRWATEAGGCIIGHAIHAHDMLSFIHGDMARLSAYTATRVNPIETEDCAVMSVVMANGSLAALSVTLGSNEEISRLRFCFDDVMAESHTAPYTMSREPWRFVGRDAAHQARIDAALAAYAPVTEGYTGQFEAFHNALAAGGELPITLADARRSLEIATAAYWSARHGRETVFPIGPDHPYYNGWLPQA